MDAWPRRNIWLHKGRHELQDMAHVFWHGIFDTTTESSAGTKNMDRPPDIAPEIGAPEGIPGSKHQVNVLRGKTYVLQYGVLDTTTESAAGNSGYPSNNST